MKAVLTVFLSAAVNVLVTAVLPDAANAGDLFFRGDANADSRADLADAVFIFRALFVAGATPPSCRDALDADDSGTLNLADGIYLLNHLFRGGAPLPPPSPGALCPGADPTPDALDCEGGADPGSFPPGVAVFATAPNAPGIRQRSRQPLPTDAEGAYRVEAGTAFSIVVEATSNRISRAGFTLLEPLEAAGNPHALEVRADADLGDPAADGIAAGENLAPRFAREVDVWRDGIYLLEHIVLRVPGNSASSPRPGDYTLRARVTDNACATSPEATLILRVAPSTAPEVFAWVESGEPAEQLQHDAGSGNARLRGEKESRLVFEVTPNGLAGGDIEPLEFLVTAEPPFAAGADLSARFAAVAGAPGRMAMRLEDGWSPRIGTTAVHLHVLGEAQRRRTFLLEVPVVYARDIQPVWTANCTGCHEQPDPFKGLELVHPDPARTRRNLVNVFAVEPVITSTAPLLVWPYYPDRSYLHHKLRGTHLDSDVGGEGDRMPQDGGFLDEVTLRLVDSWIAQGAQ